MTPLVQANSLHIPLRSGSVNLIVTSPPYFGQRRYAGGEQQIGAEATPQEFLDALWAVTKECWRVLAPDGVMFVNLGDKRAGSSGPGTTSGLGSKPQGHRTEIAGSYTKAYFGRRKSKQMLPHRYIIGCMDGMADPDGKGWVVSDYVWNKRGGMPESVTDRCRDAHEYVFQMATSERWFSALDNVREHYSERVVARQTYAGRDIPSKEYAERGDGNPARGILGFSHKGAHPLGKTPGSVWEVTREPLRVSDELRAAFDLPEHFAPFPQDPPRKAILGWCPPGGVVLDPFAGTGTTVGVARALGRIGIGLDLSYDYLRLARWRVERSGHFSKTEQRTHRENQGGLFEVPVRP